MMRLRFLFPVAVVLLLAGCGRAEDADGMPFGGHSAHGRYVGIGIVTTNQLWDQLVRPKRDPADASAARLDDDEHVIVVVDSQTGEVRQCGDMSGYCISMNPWDQKADANQLSPAKLTKHAADLAREAQEAERAETARRK